MINEKKLPAPSKEKVETLLKNWLDMPIKVKKGRQSDIVFLWDAASRVLIIGGINDR